MQKTGAQLEIENNLHHNMFVGIMDGTFFGLGLGFASFVTVIPLFVATLTDSTALIGLIASVHMIGWQLPQIFTANRVARLKVYRPMVLLMTLHERWPFFALIFVALLIPVIGTTASLILTFVVLIMQALGGGLTATAWQSMIGKLMPLNRRGTFWGLQSAGSNILAAIGAYLAGLLLVELNYPENYAACFLLATLAMAISFVFLWMTREPEVEVVRSRPVTPRLSLAQMREIITGDSNLQAFMWARAFSQVGWMAVSFYTIYGVRHFEMNEATAGVLTGMLTLIQAAGNPILGWLGDHFGHRQIFALGSLLMAGSAFAAFAGPSIFWLYVAFGLAGCAHATVWTISMAMTLEFGTDEDRPYIIGLVNTLTSPATLLAPIVGGLLVDWFGFDVTFLFAALGALITVFILIFIVRDPRQLIRGAQFSPQ